MTTAQRAGTRPGPPPGDPSVRIGVLALQGSFSLHAERLNRLGIQPVEVRRAGALEELDGLIIPGGESSTMLKFLHEEDLLEPLLAFHRGGGVIYGTCAGAILLATEVENPAQDSLALLDIGIRRNGYGRQVDSHVAEVECPTLGEPALTVVMIRAPVITRAGGGVEVLATHRGQPVFVRQGRILATTFHPELTEDLRVHAWFSRLVADEASERNGK